MIHHSCDGCGKRIEPEKDIRYVMRMEVYAALDPIEAEGETDERDHLDDLQEILERLEADGDQNLEEDLYRQLRFDLCPQCAKRFAKNPLGREPRKSFDFSQN